MRKLLLIIFLVTIYESQAQIFQFDTEKAKLVYISNNCSYLVTHTLRTFENAWEFHCRFWDYKQQEKISILFNDFYDFGNGGASAIPRNYLSISVEPFDQSFDVLPAYERMQWLMSHELTHIIATEKPSSSDKFYRNMFAGKVMPTDENPLSMLYSYLTTPRWYCPRWYHEGIATFFETWLSGGTGRALGNYDEMVFRAMVRDSSYFYNVVGLETEGTAIDFQVGTNSYLYGTRFITYLALKYGTKKLIEFYNRTDSSYRFYATQFENVYGIAVEDAWDQWIENEKQHQKRNFDLIRQYPVTPMKRITEEAVGSVSRAWFDEKTRLLYCAINNQGDFAKIVSINIDNGKIEKISDVMNPGIYFVTSLALDLENHLLFSATNNKFWRGLKITDLNTKTDEISAELTRCGDFCFNKHDKSLWGIQNNNARTTLVKFLPPYEKHEPILTIPYGKSLYDIDISPDGKYISATLSEISGRKLLVRYNINDLYNGKQDFDTIYEFKDNTAANFIHSPDGRYLYGTSYYTGVSNIWRVEIATKNAEILTNCETGLFRPVMISSDTLIAFEYTAKGMLPVLIKINPVEDVNAIEYLGQAAFKANPELEEWALPPPSAINIDSLKLDEGKYEPAFNTELSSIYPIVEGFQKYPSYGIRANFADYFMFSSLSLTASYSPNTQLAPKDRWHAAMSLKYWLFTFKASWNYADFYDLFGPTKISRRGYSMHAKYEYTPFSTNAPKKFVFSLYAALYGDLDKLPDYQNINAVFDKIYTAGASFNWSLLRKTLGAVDNEAGYSIKLNLNNYFVNKKYIPKFLGSVDLGALLPVNHLSLWLRLAGGCGFGDRRNPFTNYYFGSFGNNYLEKQTTAQYREPQSFAGAEINEIGGSNFAKATLDLNLPPVRFRKLGFLSFYATYARLNLFASVLGTDLDRKELFDKYFNTGAQFDIELVWFSQIKSMLSLGWGRVFRNRLEPKDELMVSLKLF
jgi:hypothetical protein